MKKVERATKAQFLHPMHVSSSTYVKRASVGAPSSSISSVKCEGTSVSGSIGREPKPPSSSL